MSKTCTSYDDALYNYMLSVSLREPEVLKKLREETSKHPRAVMQISADEGQFLALLIKTMRAKKTIEIGVFTGYSSISVALALPADGRIVACDISEEFTNIAKRYWKEAGVENKIDFRLAPAIETLNGLIANGETGTFDFAFIDADKPNYGLYYEKCLELVRSGGIIAIDNVFWHGEVTKESASTENQKIRELNAKLGKDERIEVSMVAIGDGVTLAYKK
eukprot:TRINITY_DN1075_c0_g1_i3.p1 TRINITY_DN1075_c0_g1~~TRINITY_DN1075_c0_g1_i3.p1  ORF type:complete len:220 (+),score=27.90 TRINITY_DN1075_c0_g1_i3:37-696(+)